MVVSYCGNAAVLYAFRRTHTTFGAGWSWRKRNAPPARCQAGRIPGAKGGRRPWLPVVSGRADAQERSWASRQGTRRTGRWYTGVKPRARGSSGWHRSTSQDRRHGGYSPPAAPRHASVSGRTMARPITTEILDCASLTAAQKLVLVAIASHGATAFPSQKRLSQLTSLSVRTVKRSVAELRKMGILATHHDRASLTYTIVMGGDTVAPMVPPCPQGGATVAPRVVTQWPPNSKGNSKSNSTPSPPSRKGGGRARVERLPF